METDTSTSRSLFNAVGWHDKRHCFVSINFHQFLELRTTMIVMVWLRCKTYRILLYTSDEALTLILQEMLPLKFWYDTLNSFSVYLFCAYGKGKISEQTNPQSSLFTTKTMKGLHTIFLNPADNSHSSLVVSVSFTFIFSFQVLSSNDEREL